MAEGKTKRVGLKEAELCAIHAGGWLRRYLDTQAEGMTGNMDKIGGPFAKQYWGNRFAKEDVESDVFLGGLQAGKVGWVPFEQTGYWIDGMIRCGYLTDNRELTRKAKRYIYEAIDTADEDGFIGADFLKDRTVWAHAVFFRSLMAEYSATNDERVLEALKKHFLRVPIADVFDKYKEFPMVGMRNIADVETALWIYEKSGDRRFLDMAEKSYERFNEKYYDDRELGVRTGCKSRDITLKGMLGNRKVCQNHGVTYNEVCKIAAILYQYTGKEIYKKAVVHAFDKLYRDQMLVDGVHSSTEYLNGNETSLASHETCDVSDFSWAVGYLYMITGDSKYGDWIEDAIFNAGLGSVDDDFKGNQYFSCPNQVICDDTSNHNLFFRGEDWMSYAPKELLCCCAGNVHRFMPNYVIRSWMTDNADGVYATLYGPSTFRTVVGGKKVKITEETNYPFENQVKFTVDCDEAAEFTMYLRNPGWAKNTKVKVNGKTISPKKVNGFFAVKKVFAPKDTVEILFEAEVKLIENARGISVKYGPLLYALPVKEKVVIEGLRELENPDFPHYSLYPESKWNYGFDMERKNEIRVEQLPGGVEPWRSGCGGTTIEIPVREVTDWKLRNIVNGKKRKGPRGPVNQEIGHKCVLMPVVRTEIKEKNKGARETVKLVPYGTTRLRIAIFPKV